MQVEFGGKEHEEAIAKILAAAKAANKVAAIFCTSRPSPLCSLLIVTTVRGTDLH